MFDKSKHEAEVRRIIDMQACRNAVLHWEASGPRHIRPVSEDIAAYLQSCGMHGTWQDLTILIFNFIRIWETAPSQSETLAEFLGRSIWATGHHCTSGEPLQPALELDLTPKGERVS